MLEELYLQARERELTVARTMIAFRMEADALRRVERLEAQLVKARARAALMPTAAGV